VEEGLRGQCRGTDATVVIGVNWLGDTILSLPALAALRDHLKGEPLHILAPTHLLPLYEMASVVDQAQGLPGSRRLWEGIRRLREVKYRRAVVFPNSFRSALMVWMGGIGERWGYATQGRGPLLNRRVPDSIRPRGLHHSEHFLELIRQMGWNEGEAPPIRLQVGDRHSSWASSALEQINGRRTGPLVGICPGAIYGPAKRWGIEGFRAVAHEVATKMEGAVVLVGTKEEGEALGDLWREIRGSLLNLMGMTDIGGLAAVLALCDAVVANDSGVMHLASVLGTPVVAIFGSTDPKATRPLGPHRIVKKDVECAPCLKRVCPTGTYQCLRSITPAQVIKQLYNVLRSNSHLRPAQP
jgi:heptosyltransferase-2